MGAQWLCRQFSPSWALAILIIRAEDELPFEFKAEFFNKVTPQANWPFQRLRCTCLQSFADVSTPVFYNET